MDESKSAITVSLYVVVVAGVVTVGLASYSFYRNARVAEADLSLDFESDEGRSGTPLVRSPRRPFTSGQVAPERVDRLQVLVERTRNLLEARTRELEQKTKEYERLEADLEAALELLMQFAGQPERKPGDPASVPAKEERDAVGTTVENLRMRTLAYERELLAQSAEIEELRKELAEVSAEMLEDRIFGRRSNLAEELLSQDAEFREAVSGAFAQIGAPAVTQLMELLTHAHPEVKRFAARTLGAIGADAVEAEAMLMRLASDDDPATAQAAQEALERIELAK